MSVIRPPIVSALHVCNHRQPDMRQSLTPQTPTCPPTARLILRSILLLTAFFVFLARAAAYSSWDPLFHESIYWPATFLCNFSHLPLHRSQQKWSGGSPGKTQSLPRLRQIAVPTTLTGRPTQSPPSGPWAF
ncbi:hypothetical protein IWX92DRAFT_438518 [Phyllosticta citricarpa]